MSDCPASVSDDLENILGVPREYYYLWGDKILLLASKKWIGEFSGLNIYTYYVVHNFTYPYLDTFICCKMTANKASSKISQSRWCP